MAPSSKTPPTIIPAISSKEKSKDKEKQNEAAKAKTQLLTGTVIAVWIGEDDKVAPTITSMIAVGAQKTMRSRTVHLELKTAKEAIYLVSVLGDLLSTLRRWPCALSAAAISSLPTVLTSYSSAPVLTQLQIQIRSLPQDHLIFTHTQISVRIPVLIPVYQLPHVTDEILGSTSARHGAIIRFQESTSIREPLLDIITKYNATIPAWVVEKYAELKTGIRRQVTWKLLYERVALWKKDTHLMYLSGLLMEFPLVRLWKKEKLFCMPCDTCSGVVFGNGILGLCERCEKGIELRINPQVLGMISDETAGVGGRGREHNILIADRVWEKLLGVYDGRLGDDGIDEQWLRGKEQEINYTRYTWVLMWLGDWGSGRLVLVNVLDWRAEVDD